MPSPLRPTKISTVLTELRNLAGAPDATARFFDVWNYFSTIPPKDVDAFMHLNMLKESAKHFDKIPSFSTHDFMLGFVPHAQQWCTRAQPVIDKFPRDDLLDMFKSFRQMRILPPPALLNRALGHFALCDRQDFVKGTHIIHALAFLGVAPPTSLVTAITPAIKTAPQQAFMQHYPRLVWSLACADATAHDPIYRKIAYRCINRALKAPDTGQPTATTVGMTFYACQWFDLPNPNDRPYERNLTSSAYERKVGDLLEHLGFDLLHDHIRYLPELDKMTDFALATPDGTVHLELDGPLHFIYRLGDDTMLHYDGSTRLISALLQKKRPETPFIRVPFADMNRLSHLPDDELAKTLKDIFTDAAASTQSGQGNVRILSCGDGKPHLAPVHP